MSTSGEQDPDFSARLMGAVPTTIEILYGMPDFPRFTQVFRWQTLDYDPFYPRIGRFIHFWKCTLAAQAPIRSIRIGTDNGPVRPADIMAYAKDRNFTLLLPPKDTLAS